jgi:hypothetical protein
MKIIKILPVFVFCSGMLMLACNQQPDPGDIPARVVYNPVSADNQANTDKLPRFEFKETTHDIGTVIQGEKVTFAYKFKNTGNHDLLIAKVTASCGCTATTYPKHPIKPGEESVVTITFDSEGRLGVQNKSVSIVANTQPNVNLLRIKAKIIRPEKTNN